jgi:predicted  nucleic acid-binding Zn-ribbon protein
MVNDSQKNPGFWKLGGTNILIIILLAVVASSIISWAMVSSLAAAKSNYESDIPKINNKIGHIEDSITGLDNLTNNQVTKLSELSDNADIGFKDINIRVDDVNSRVDNTDSKLDATKTDLDSQITSLNSSIDQKANQTDLSTLEGKVTTLEGKVTTLETRVTTLETRVTTLESKVTSITYSIPSGIIDATYDQDRFIWTADGAYQVVKVSFQQSVVESTNASTTLMLKKVLNGTAISSGIDLLASAVNLKSAVMANAVLNPSLNATTTNIKLAVGDSIALDFTNGLTEYVGYITITVIKI